MHLRCGGLLLVQMATIILAQNEGITLSLDFSGEHAPP